MEGHPLSSLDRTEVPSDSHSTQSAIGMPNSQNLTPVGTQFGVQEDGTTGAVKVSRHPVHHRLKDSSIPPDFHYPPCLGLEGSNHTPPALRRVEEYSRRRQIFIRLGVQIVWNLSRVPFKPSEETRPVVGVEAGNLPANPVKVYYIS